MNLLLDIYLFIYFYSVGYKMLEASNKTVLKYFCKLLITVVHLQINVSSKPGSAIYSSSGSVQVRSGQASYQMQSIYKTISVLLQSSSSKAAGACLDFCGILLGICLSTIFLHTKLLNYLKSGSRPLKSEGGVLWPCQ